jgi:hypothetical protein
LEEAPLRFGRGERNGRLQLSGSLAAPTEAAESVGEGGVPEVGAL